MNKLLIVVLAALVASTAFEVSAGARPCRPGFPNCRRPHPPPPPPPPPPTTVTTVYQRVIPAMPGAALDRVRLSRLLRGSSWTRLGSRDQIRFVDPPSTQHFARPPGSRPAPRRDRYLRAIAIDLVRDRYALLVNIDGALYTVTTCPTNRRTASRRPVMTTCLEHRQRVPFGGQYGGATYGGRR